MICRVIHLSIEFGLVTAMSTGRDRISCLRTTIVGYDCIGIVHTHLRIQCSEKKRYITHLAAIPELSCTPARSQLSLQ